MEPFYSDKLELSDSDNATHCEFMNFDNYATFDQDLFSACPHEVKLEILSYLTDPSNLCNMSFVCKNWNMATSENRIWKFMFYRDFMWWSGAKSESVEINEGQSWKDKYSEYYLRGWQWDPSSCNQRIQLENNNFSASLTTGYTYHGIRTTRGEERGRHYFEILIEPTVDNTKFDRGATIFMGIGVANEKFNVENCCSGWTRDNCGIGYYNDGQIYALSERHFANSRKTSFKAGDRVGVEFDLENSYVIFYINGVPVTEPIPGLRGKVYPHVILANDIKHTITITTGRKGSTKTITTTSTIATPKEQKSIYENQLKVLEEMGFTNREVLTEMLARHSGDVERLVNELLT